MASPLLLNVALHGLEQAAGVRYRKTGPRAGMTMPGAPVLVRYADDFAVCCQSRQQAEQIKARLAEWLQPRGLAINEDKTRIAHLPDFSELILLSGGCARASSDLSEGRHAEFDVPGAALGGGIELCNFVLGPCEADLQAFDLAEPSFTFGFGDSVLQIVADLLQARPLGGILA